MKRVFPVHCSAIIPVLLFFATLFAQNVNITGLITDHKGAPVADAGVVLKNNSSITCRTNSEGKYTLFGSVNNKKSFFKTVSNNFFWLKGNDILFFVSENEQHVTIAIYTINGKKLAVIVDNLLIPGTYSYPLFSKTVPSSVYLIVIDINGAKTVFKKMNLRPHNSAPDALFRLDNSNTARFNTTSNSRGAAVDTIEASKIGFETRTRALESLAGTQDFTLAPLNIPVLTATIPLPVKTTLSVSHTAVSNYGINPKICVLGNGDNSFDVGLLLSQSLQIQVLLFNAEGLKTGEITPACISGAGTLLGIAKIPDDSSYAAGYSKDNAFGNKNFAYWITRFDKTGNQIFSTQIFGDKHTDSTWSKGTPGDASSGRIAYNRTTGKIGFYCGHTMKWDDGVRHQGGFVGFMTKTGAFDTANGWFYSHNFDQRLAVVDSFYYMLAHGDAYPRALGFSKWNDKSPKGKKLVDVQYFAIPGTVGDNATKTQTGSFIPLSDGTFGIVFTSSVNRQNYDVCYKRITGNGVVLDSVWLTAYPAATFAIFSKIAIYGKCVLLTWEEVTNKIPVVQTMVIDYSGNILSTKKTASAAALSPFYDLVTLPCGDIIWAVLKGSDSLSVCRIKP